MENPTESWPATQSSDVQSFSQSDRPAIDPPAVTSGEQDNSSTNVVKAAQSGLQDDRDKGIVVNASDMNADLLKSKKKKKKSRKPASKRGLGKPTGFEEFCADSPLTLEEYAESKSAFDHRILKAIQRFERTRKLSPERRDVFYKYLAYGGVDVSPNMFVGGQNTEDMDHDQITAAMARADISEETKQAIIDPKKEEDDQDDDTPNGKSRLYSSEYMAKYIVDFEGTMRSFLSRYAPTTFVLDSQSSTSLITTTLERFMDYLLQHDVCPEYNTEVLQTRNLCRAAQTELWTCAEASRNLPGDFNIACSTLFGGTYGEHYDGGTHWNSSETQSDVFVGLTAEKATQIIGFAVAGAATEDIYTKYLEITAGESAGKGFEVITTIYDHGFEITKVEQPTKECRDLYKENTDEFRPVGRVYAKFFRNPDAPPEDLTPAERAELALTKATHFPPDHPVDFVFFIESEFPLKYLHKGMRIEATIYELNCGVWFFDEVIRVFPSFDLWLENELMMGWKEPRPVAGAPDLEWNERYNGTDAGRQLECEDVDINGDVDLDTSNDVGAGTSAIEHEDGSNDIGNDIAAGGHAPVNPAGGYDHVLPHDAPY